MTQNYEIRKHYEAAIDDLAKIYGVKRDYLRAKFKAYLMLQKIIGYSTTELSDEMLKELADKISIYVSRMENTPPNERGFVHVMEFDNILKINLRDDEKTNDETTMLPNT